MKLRLFVLLIATVVWATPAGAGELQDDLIARRAAIMQHLAPEDMLVLWSAPERVYSLDIDYEFRQDSNLYYLTAIDQPDTILVLMPGNRERTAFLFISPSNPEREHWTGHLLTPAEATAQSGIATVYPTTAFDAFMDSVLAGGAYGVPAGSPESPAFSPHWPSRRRACSYLARRPASGARCRRNTNLPTARAPGSSDCPSAMRPPPSPVRGR